MSHAIGSMVSDKSACEHTKLAKQWSCFHGRCVIALVFNRHAASDGSFMLRNEAGYVRRFLADEVRER
jgi:hypothetical protein